MRPQLSHGLIFNFWADMAATAAATSVACCHCHRRFLFCKIQARPRPWGLASHGGPAVAHFCGLLAEGLEFS